MKAFLEEFMKKRGSLEGVSSSTFEGVPGNSPEEIAEGIFEGTLRNIST